MKHFSRTQRWPQARICAALLVLVVGAMSCRGGGGSPTPPNPSVLFGIAGEGTTAVVYGPPGSADRDTTANVTAGGGGSAVVAPDGSFVMHVANTGEVGSNVTVIYVKQRTALQTIVTLESLASRVNPSLFSTGAGPNDIDYHSGSLFVANSLDNSVVKYSTAGAVQHSTPFPTGASPSFLEVAGNTVWVVSNGSNTLQGLRQGDLSALSSLFFQFESPGFAFIGPAQPIFAGDAVYVPRNQLRSYGPPTEYGQGRVSRCDTADEFIDTFSTVGINPGFGAFDAGRDLLYVVSAGEIQFDEDFQPHAESDSFLEMFDTRFRDERLGTLNLGPIGAQRIALREDGNIAYVANALNGNLYKVDLADGRVLRGNGNPIRLTTDFTYISDVQFTPDGRWLLATSFNTDELYVIDPQTDQVNPGLYAEPFDLSGGSAFLAGPVRMAIGPTPSASGSFRVYVALGVANAVASVDLF